MIGLRGLGLRRGGRALLTGADMVLHAGWKVGVIGRNGSGKSSLFAAIKGELEPDHGSIDLPTQTRMASVAQETPALAEPAIDYVLGGDVDVAAALAAEALAREHNQHAELAAAHQRIDALRGYDAHARAGKLLHGLGFAADTHQQAVREFSGGWRVRLNLARALMAPSDLLLLDEPTNHLDLDAVLWLQQWLRRYAGTLLIISHDRDFLDEVTTHTVHLHDGRATLYTGNYSAFERQRAEQLRQQQIAHDKETAERAHLQSFIDRFKAKASKAKQAQSRVKQLEKMAGTEAVRLDRPFHFTLPTPQRLPQSLLKLSHVDAGYQSQGKTNRVLAGVTFGLESGDRIGLLGANGAGKSTLVKTLVGELPMLGGERVAHKDMRIGYFAQHTVEGLREGASPFDHLQELAPTSSAQELRNFLGSWHFIGDRAFEPIDNFSGGERARLALALIAWGRPNLLLLDEPTNHLDLDMREALADALNDFEGALVLVAHDRHLLSLVCEQFLHVSKGSVTEFSGDLDDYATWLRERDLRDSSDATPNSKLSGKDRRRAAAEQREREKPLRNRLRKAERRMGEIEAELARIGIELGKPEAHEGDDAAVAELVQQEGRLRVEHNTLETEWLECTDELEH